MYIIRATQWEGKRGRGDDDATKLTRVLSGGKQQHMVFAQLALQKPNVPLMLMDEPTNHLDMECIESLNTALEKY